MVASALAGPCFVAAVDAAVGAAAATVADIPVPATADRTPIEIA